MRKETIITDENFLKKGRMKKSPFLMGAEELSVWEEQEKINVRDYLFSIGQPLIYEKNGIMIAEYADGRIKEL